VSIASSDHSDEDTVFNKEYEPSILAVLSGQIVAFPETKEPINGMPKINVYYLINPLGPSAPYFFFTCLMPDDFIRQWGSSAA
jgi:hypothetical protein